MPRLRGRPDVDVIAQVEVVQIPVAVCLLACIRELFSHCFHGLAHGGAALGLYLFGKAHGCTAGRLFSSDARTWNRGMHDLDAEAACNDRVHKALTTSGLGFTHGFLPFAEEGGPRRQQLRHGSTMYKTITPCAQGQRVSYWAAFALASRAALMSARQAASMSSRAASSWSYQERSSASLAWPRWNLRARR